ncbi:OSIGBa0097A15.7 protein [Puccinia sorghi]|uniref:OSIGBa0097A15.7 protein n=1 Tax=Puccinia sorghi TaxID=27349 RepID=A0A0L6UY97_9BASI|nr:OSIGBa0097A15.7 protein [Puccinia sorghi]
MPKTLCRSIPLRETNSLTSTQPDEDFVNPNGYLSIVGSLNYLAVATRPDLSFAFGFLSRFAKLPTTRHWSAVQHTLGYIKALCCGAYIGEGVTAGLSSCCR